MDKLKKTLFQQLEAPRKGWDYRRLDLFLMLLIISNVIAVVLESDADLYSQYGDWFFRFEVFSVFIFSIEYFVRVWVSTEHKDEKGEALYSSRLKYMLSPLALIDLIAIIPSYMGLFFNFDLRVLRTIRLLRIFKLTRYSSAMELLLTVLRQELPSFLSASFLMLVAVLMAASGMYLVEQHAQPEQFGSIPKSIWWAVVTLTTVGYGDIVPVTLAGKLLGGVITLLGVTMVALPAGILAAGFSAELARRKDMYRTQVRDALEDGDLSWNEKRLLGVMRNRLGLTKEEARIMIAEGRYEARESTALSCPHCNEPIFIAHPAGQIVASKHKHEGLPAKDQS